MDGGRKVSSHLVIGGEGTVGRVLVRSLSSRGEIVISVDRVPPVQSLRGVSYLVADLGIGAPLDLPFDVDVVHFAAVSLRRWMSRAALERENLQLLVDVLQLAATREVKKVVVISSSTVFGETPPRTCVVPPLLRRAGLYGECRRKGEESLREAGQRGISYVLLRPHIVIAPEGNGYLQHCFSRILQGRDLYLPSSARRPQQMVAVEDLVEACLLAAASRASAELDIGASTVEPLTQILRHLIGQVASPSRLFLVPTFVWRLGRDMERLVNRMVLGPAEIWTYRAGLAVDCGEATKVLGWRASKGCREAVELAFEAYRKRPSEDVEWRPSSMRQAHGRRT